MFFWMIGTCNHGLKFLVRFTGKFSSKYLSSIFLPKWAKFDEFALKLTYWSSRLTYIKFLDILHYGIIFSSLLNKKLTGKYIVIAYLDIVYGHWAHSIFSMHSLLVTSLRGFETKLKFLHKKVFQDANEHNANEHFHAKRFKAIWIHMKLQA